MPSLTGYALTQPGERGQLRGTDSSAEPGIAGNRAARAGPRSLPGQLAGQQLAAGPLTGNRHAAQPGPADNPGK